MRESFDILYKIAQWTNCTLPLLQYLRSPVPLPRFPFQREICKFPLQEVK